MLMLYLCLYIFTSYEDKAAARPVTVIVDSESQTEPEMEPFKQNCTNSFLGRLWIDISLSINLTRLSLA